MVQIPLEAVAPVGTENIETQARENNDPKPFVDGPEVANPQVQAIQQAIEQAIRAKIAEQESQIAEINRADAPAADVVFVSKFPSVTLYPLVNGRPVRIDFANGIYRAKDPRIAEALRREKRFRKIFNEATKSETAAMRSAIERNRAALNNPVQSGLDTSTFGSDALIMSQRSALDAAEENLMKDF
jgi:hypothetical protein